MSWYSDCDWDGHRRGGASARKISASSPARASIHDDISRPGETRALFVRSPHAHAKIKRIDVSCGEEDARRGRGAHRRAIWPRTRSAI